MNVVMKRTNDLDMMTIYEMKGVINAYEMDVNQRAINLLAPTILLAWTHPPTMPFQLKVGLLCSDPHWTGQSTTPVYHSSTPSKASSRSTTATPLSSNVRPAPQIPVISKETEETIALIAGFMNCYNAFLTNDIVSLVTFTDLDHIHPVDVKEL